MSLFIIIDVMFYIEVDYFEKHVQEVSTCINDGDHSK